MNQSYGKFIITGEHSVVHGELALVSSLKKTITVTVSKVAIKPERSEYESHILDLFEKEYGVDTSFLKLQVKSEIPENSGLGSSAAFAHAVLQALADFFNISIPKDEMFQLVLDSEVFIHKKPSGIDPCAVVYGGVHSFRRDLETGKFEKQKMSLPKKYVFLLINSGKATESTGEMVSLVAGKIKKEPELKKTIQKIGKISKSIYAELNTGIFSGDLLDKNQTELEKLGVVGETAKKMIAEIRKTDAHVKITGAGGIQTGSGWLLVYSKDLSSVNNLCKENAWENIETEVK